MSRDAVRASADWNRKLQDATLRLFILPFMAIVLALATTARAESEIVIGAVLTLSGDEAVAGTQVLDGLQRAVAKLNQAGGIEIAGTFVPVRLEVFDDRGSDRRAVALAGVLVLRRAATVVVAGSRISAAMAVVPLGSDYRIPMIDVVGLPASQAPGETPYGFSVLPSLEDRWMPALTLAVLVRRMQEREPASVPFGVVADDAVLEATALRLAAGWGLGAEDGAGEAGDGVTLLLDAPETWDDTVLPGGGIVIVPACDDAERLRLRRPAGAILCTALWRRAGKPSNSENAVSAEMAVLAVAQAIYRGRSAYGPVLRDILMLLNAETPAGPIRFGADGRNAALATRLFTVETDGLHEIDPADPSSLWGDMP
jgi:ABC-type branched-subunit amino acid transport system substrate-binding protein